MSELMNASRRNIRRELMVTVSTLAFFTSLCSAGSATASDESDRPTVWIELGAQSEVVRGSGESFAPPFTSEIIADGFTSPIKSQQALSQSVGGEGNIFFNPKGTEWIFSVSALYGRANGQKATHDQAPNRFHVSSPTTSGVHTGYFTPIHHTARFSELHIANRESHLLLDFQAGRDIGVGLFGSGVKSTFNFGARFAQFESNKVMDLRADPDLYFPKSAHFHPKYHHSYHTTSHADRSFRGLGPSLSWKASAPVVGNTNDGGISVDWGLNAAVLFGRQKMRGHHQTLGTFYKSNYLLKYHHTTHSQRSGSPDRSHSVVVPNLGGFAGASFNFSNAKVSLGYRADFFFGAMDGGIDARKSETLGFYGPFASISVGLGG